MDAYDRWLEAHSAFREARALADKLYAEARKACGPEPHTDKPNLQLSEAEMREKDSWRRTCASYVEKAAKVENPDLIWSAAADEAWDALCALMETEARSLDGVTAKLDAWLSDEFDARANELARLSGDQLPTVELSREQAGLWLINLYKDTKRLTGSNL